MRHRDVRLAGLAAHLPDRVVTSESLEERLAPVYERLRLRVGRLELMTGIRERRHFEPGTRPSAIAATAGRRALEASGVDPGRIGVLVHASVCRDFLEPATASVVHEALQLPTTAQAFDLSNACLGFVDAVSLVGTLLDAGRVDAGLVVAGEDGGPLVEATIAALLAAAAPTKQDLKAAFASLTIGSGAAAAVVTRADLAPDAPRVTGGTSRAATEHVRLCEGDRTDGVGPLMETDSEALLVAGCALAARTWPAFLDDLAWERSDVTQIVTHQVGVAHRRALLAALELPESLDHPTVETLGNVGSVSLPASLAAARAAGRLSRGDKVALLGIGSGLQCHMLGLEW